MPADTGNIERTADAPASGPTATAADAAHPVQVPALTVEKLCFRYPNGRQALDNVSFQLREREILAVVGPSGAGKSTLLLHLNGLLPKQLEEPSAGAIQIGRIPMQKAHLTEIRRLVGFLFQDPDDQLFCPTVREDVAFGPLNLGLNAGEVEQRVVESLEAVGLSSFAERSTLQLSVGERKRVCLAGVLACRPSILALDEPFSNLDPRARKSLIAILRRFEGSLILTTHDLDTVVELCDRVIILDEGRVRAEGVPAEILSRPQLMERHGLEVPMRLR
ncbi:MAG: energy-coupling factor ABC transporter ATP-binding protein [Planctomycetaceae bacterium]